MANLQAPTTISGTSSVKLPTGTTAQRPSASAGMTRFNSTLGYAEYYNGTTWTKLTTPREAVLSTPNYAVVAPATFSGNDFSVAASNNYFSPGYFGVDKAYTLTNGNAITKIKYRRLQTGRYYWWFLITTKSGSTYTCTYGALIEVPPGGTAGDILEASLANPNHPLSEFGSRQIPSSGTYYLSWMSAAPGYPSPGPAIYSDASSGGQIDFVSTTTAPVLNQTYTVTNTNEGARIHIQVVYGDNRDSHVYADTNGYRTHAFLAGTHTFTPQFTGNVEVMVVAGGGGGSGAGGGGAGGVVYNNSFPVVAGTSYTATVGRGGYGMHWDRQGGTNTRGTNGENSVFGSITSIGGGAGGAYGTANTNGVAGGSGGGGGHDSGGSNTTGGAGTSGQGFAGGNKTYAGNNPYSSAGGGGAAGAAGNAMTSSVSSHGGPGLPFTIAGQTFYFGGGGGGGAQSSSGTNAVGGNGGSGGGAGGAVWTAASGGTAGTGDVFGGLNPGKIGRNAGSTNHCDGGDGGVNTGGGGGGAGISVCWGGGGGSGIILVRYPVQAPATVAQEFKTVGTYQWTAPSGVSQIELLVVAGGGGGGGRAGSGGGGGGVFYSPAYIVSPGSTYTVVVGDGGVGGAGGNDGTEANGSRGSNSSFDTLVCYGGGGGIKGDTNGVAGTGSLDGGSGGGGGYDNSAGGSGLYNQGYPGGASTAYSTTYPYVKAGGGGANGAGASAHGSFGYGGQGGAGLPSMISGVPKYYGGGGGGGSHNPSNRSGRGGVGGGGDAGSGSTKSQGYNALANTGGGGGGACTDTANSLKGGNGGSGIVIIRYRP